MLEALPSGGFDAPDVPRISLPNRKMRSILAKIGTDGSTITAKIQYMKALLEQSPASLIEKPKNGMPLRRIIYGAIIVYVLILAFLSAVGRFSMLMDAHDWIFGR